MHKLQMYENLRDMLEREVMEIEKKGSIDSQNLDHLYKLMTALKATDRCIEREGGSSYGRSYDSMNSMRMMPNSYGMSYDDGYSRDNFRSNSYRGRSYDAGQSRQKMMDSLQMLMNEATNENERQAIMDCMNKM